MKKIPNILIVNSFFFARWWLSARNLKKRYQRVGAAYPLLCKWKSDRRKEHGISLRPRFDSEPVQQSLDPATCRVPLTRYILRFRCSQSRDPRPFSFLDRAQCVRPSREALRIRQIVNTLESPNHLRYTSKSQLVSRIFWYHIKLCITIMLCSSSAVYR